MLLVPMPDREERVEEKEEEEEEEEAAEVESAVEMGKESVDVTSGAATALQATSVAVGAELPTTEPMFATTAWLSRTSTVTLPSLPMVILVVSDLMMVGEPLPFMWSLLWSRLCLLSDTAGGGSGRSSRVTRARSGGCPLTRMRWPSRY